MNTVFGAARTWKVPRPLLEDQLAFGALSGLGLLLTSVIGVFVFDRFEQVTQSAWDLASSLIVWYVAGIAGYLAWRMTPLWITSGRTRRNAYMEMLMVVGAIVILATGITVIGYLIENGVYAMADWPRAVPDDHHFDSHTDVGPMLVEHAVQYLLWGSAGYCVGFALYRYEHLGWVSLIVAAGLLGVIGSAGETGPFGFVIDRIPSMSAGGLGTYVVLALLVVAISIGASWFIARDMPIRRKS
jgi:hypothetical protein